MTKTTPRYFWETNNFLIVMTQDKSYGMDVLDSANAIINDVERNKTILVTSSIVLGEVLEGHAERINPGSYARFRGWLRRINVDVRNVDTAVAERAAEIREALLARNDEAKVCPKCKRSTDHRRWADIIFTATASLYSDLDEIHSVDQHFQKLASLCGSGLDITAPSHPSIVARRKSLFPNGLSENGNAEAANNNPQQPSLLVTAPALAPPPVPPSAPGLEPEIGERCEDEDTEQ
jgi:predicted nucleic acid-binding protein